MAKRTGLGQQFFVEGWDISGDVSSIDMARASRALEVVTGIDKSASERIPLLADGELDFSVWHDPPVEGAALKGLPTTDIGVLWLWSQLAGDVTAYLQAKQIDYVWARALSGSLKGKVQVKSSAGNPIEYGVLLAPKKTHASATAEAYIDDLGAGAPSASGAVGYLEFFGSLGSGTCTFIVEHSVDHVTWATLLSFAALTGASARQSQRVAVTGTVNRYIRVSSTGVFTSATFAAAFRRKTAQDIL